MKTQSASPTVQMPNPFVPVFPAEREVVMTNQGQAGRIGEIWFKWWPEMKSFARMGMKSEVLWWEDDQGVRHSLVPPEPRVFVRAEIGQRKFTAMGWSRKDNLYVGTTLIGVIKKSSENIGGVTISVTTGSRLQGWNPSWALEQHLAATKARAANVKEAVAA